MQLEKLRKQEKLGKQDKMGKLGKQSSHGPLRKLGQLDVGKIRDGFL